MQSEAESDWRGLFVLAIWLLWPVAFVFGSIVFDFPDQCVVDGCGPPTGWWDDAPYFLGILVVPLVVTAVWVRWHIKRRAALAKDV